MDDLPQRLQQALDDPRWRRVRTRSSAPTLAYGRHRGPAPADARQAAVAIAFLRRPDQSWIVPLTLRPTNLRHHAGQICFPGGGFEPGETPVQAALREFEEELGLLPVEPTVRGQLDPIYVYPSNHLVYPVVFTGGWPDSAWRPDPAEVDTVIELPLDKLRCPRGPINQIRSRKVFRESRLVGEYHFDAVAYHVDQHGIWGATAMLLRQLADIVTSGGPTATAHPLTAACVASLASLTQQGQDRRS